MLMVLTNKKSTTNPDKIAQMHPKKANKIWYRIVNWQSEKFNRELREQSKDDKR